MKKLIFFIFFSLFSIIICAQGYTLFLTGASFAAPGNGWFELGCKDRKSTV